MYYIEYSYLVLDTIYFARSKFCPSEVPTVHANNDNYNNDDDDNAKDDTL